MAVFWLTLPCEQQGRAAVKVDPYTQLRLQHPTFPRAQAA
tara:strand:+ start:267 stop:386 length:120 start_codon:yes stop_codon:yes gene_type:complete